MPDDSDILRHEARIALQRTRQRGFAEEWALVLMSQGLHPQVRASDGFWVLSVPLEEAAPAGAALAAYLHENPIALNDEPAVVERFAETDSDGLHTGLWVSGALLAFFLVTGPRHEEVMWFTQGSADAAKLIGGEYWRSVTALTLHADLVHVISNAIFGALLIGTLCSLLGNGLACALVLVSGALANTLNALFQSPFHNSIGASTGVFAALGLLAALSVARRRSVGVRGQRVWIPVAAGLGVLAMLGTGGERVDLWAHLLGFAVGAAVGLAFAASTLPIPGRRMQTRLAIVSLGTIVGCWLLALS